MALSPNDSYATIAEFDDFFPLFFDANVFSSVASGDLEAVKERLLRLGTLHVNTSYRSIGVKTDEDQSLPWPRIVNSYDFGLSYRGGGGGYNEGRSLDIADDVVPTAVKRAAMFAAVKIYQDGEDKYFSTSVSQDGSGLLVKSESQIGPVKEVREWDPTVYQVNPLVPKIPFIDRLLEDYIIHDDDDYHWID